MILRQLIVIAMLPLLSGCAHLFTQRGVPARQQWPVTLVTVHHALAGERFSDADQLLQDFVHRHGGTAPAHEAIFWRGVVAIHAPADTGGSLDSAIAHLDSYMAAGSSASRYFQALALRKLAAQSLAAGRELGRVRQALSQARSDTPARADAPREPPRADNRNLAAEIESLRSELNRANQELERIRRRLSGQNP
jgi:hypothetical protein